MSRILNIAFCDDSTTERQALHVLTSRLLQRLGVEGRFLDYSSAEAIMFEDSARFDLVFLDIEMDRASGLDAARSIRAENKSVPIVFVTAFANYAIEGYGVGAYRYLLKPVDEQGFMLDMEPLVKELTSETSHVLPVRCGEAITMVDLRDVLYITTGKDRKVDVVTTEGTYTTAESLKHWEEAVLETGTNDFFKCHGSVIINFRYLKHVRTNDVVMADGALLPLSKRNKRALSEAALKYRGFHA